MYMTLSEGSPWAKTTFLGWNSTIFLDTPDESRKAYTSNVRVFFRFIAAGRPAHFNTLTSQEAQDVPRPIRSVHGYLLATVVMTPAIVCSASAAREFAP
jgi:hypothetical protein